MAFFQTLPAQHAIENFKVFTCELLEALQTKQEVLARQSGVTQGCISQWLDVDSERNMPAAIIPLLDSSLSLPILNYLLQQAAKRKPIDLNGSVGDEIIGIVGLLAKIDELDRNGGTIAEITINTEKIKELADRIVEEKRPK